MGWEIDFRFSGMGDRFSDFEEGRSIFRFQRGEIDFLFSERGDLGFHTLMENSRMLGRERDADGEFV